jgi:capsular polysaccharide biosynthesis protein
VTDAPPQPIWFDRLLASLKGAAATIVAIAILLGFLVAGLTYHFAGKKDPVYVSTAATLLDQPRTIGLAENSGIIDKLSRLRFKYAGILRSDDVVDAVAKKVGVPRGVAAGAIVTRGDTGSLLLYVGARSGDPKKALALANAFAQQLSSYVVTEQLQAKIPEQQRLTLKVVAPARTTALVSPTKKQRYVSGLGAGLAVGVAFAGVADVVRRRRPASR